MSCRWNNFYINDSYTHCKQHYEICIISGFKTTKIFIAPLCIHNLIFGVLHNNKSNHMIQRHFIQVSKYFLSYKQSVMSNMKAVARRMELTVNE